MDLKLKVLLRIICWNKDCKRQVYLDSGKRTIEGKIIYHCKKCKSQIIIDQ